ncbi:MAG: hypothetical protein V3T30_02640 [Thermodesulfobacteriota bacterium]
MTQKVKLEILLRRKILEKLYTNFKNAPFNLTRVSSLIEELEVTLDELLWNVVYLNDAGYLSIVKKGPGDRSNSKIKIISKGVNLIEDDHEFNSRFPVSVMQNITVGGNFQGHVAGHGSAIGNINVNDQNFFAALEAEVKESTELDDTKKKSLLKSIKNLSSHPLVVNIISTLLLKFKDGSS